jgi:exodeoxyribonuclease VII large subunit
MSAHLPAEPASARDYSLSASKLLTVAELNRSVRDLIEHRLPLLWVAGEISNCVQARSGHLYFSLKDDAAQVRCVMFRSRGALLDWQPRDGMHVEVRALATLYEARGDFQLTVEFMRRGGLGALHERFLRLRDRLAAEGLFDADRKRAIPLLPRAIGIVTSPAAAALHDVITTIARRNPSIPVIVYPAAVQGDAAPQGIVAALQRAARRAEVDVLILCRGGGSIEDLWAFNDEAVARAVRASPLPVVTGIGHETDFTIADFAADCRAPTPTAAAELVSPPREELRQRLETLAVRLHRRIARDIGTRMQLLDHLARRLVHPRHRLAAHGALVAQLQARLVGAAGVRLQRAHAQLEALVRRAGRARPGIALLAAHVGELEHRERAAMSRRSAELRQRLEALRTSLGHLDPHAVLERGYAIATDAAGRVVRSGGDVAVGDRLRLAFGRGGASVRVEEAAHRAPD